MKLSIFKTALLAGATAVGMAGSASAALFNVDFDNSSVTLTETGSGGLCNFTNCGVSASLASDLEGTSFSLTNPGDSFTFDFLTFEGQGTGTASYDIEATLAFGPNPGTGSVTGGGDGGAVLLFGNIIGGVLNWTSGVPVDRNIGGGGSATVDFEGGLSIFAGNSETTSATVSLIAPIPLPAGGLLLLTALGGVAALRRKRKPA